MKRYYLCPIIGDGSSPSETNPNGNPYRAKISDYHVNHVAVIPVDMNTGKPLYTWCIVVVDTVNHTPLLADAEMDALPDFPLDGRTQDIPVAIRVALKDKLLSKYGVTITGTENIYREVIRKIGRKIDLTYDENNFDVSG